MQRTDLRFVAHVDILGMSAVVERDADEAWRLLSDLVDVRDRVLNYEIEFPQTGERMPMSEAIRAVTFSDTIVFFTRGDTDVELRALIVLAIEVLHKAMCRCVPVRVGIALGRFFFNIARSMYAGPALIEAYRVGEAAQWLGIVLAMSVQDRARALGMKTGQSDLVVEWSVPIKGGEDSRFVINWPASISHDLKVTPPLSVAQFYQAFESTFGPLAQLSAEVQAKYVNTATFLNARLALHAQA